MKGLTFQLRNKLYIHTTIFFIYILDFWVHRGSVLINRLGTKHKLIKGWYVSSTIQPTTSNILLGNISDVNKVKKLSLREILTLTTGGCPCVFHRCNYCIR